MAGSSWLDKLFAQGLSAVVRVYSGGSLVSPVRGAVEFKGSGYDVADNPSTGRTDIALDFDFEATGSHNGFMSRTQAAKLATITSGATTNDLTEGDGILITGGNAHPTIAIDPDYEATTDFAGYMSPAQVTALNAATQFVPVAASLTLPLAISADKVFTPTGDGTKPFVLALAASGHVEGHTAEIFLAADDWTALRIAQDANVQGDGVIDTDGTVTDFDPTKAYTLFVTYSQGLFTGVLRKHASARDVSAPTIVSAIIRASDLDVLELTMSQACWLLDETGLSISDTGASRTLGTLVASTNGTTLLKFALSGDVGLSDTVTFTVASGRNLQDLNGNKIATGTTGVTIAGRPFNSMANVTGDFWAHSPSEFTLSGSNVTTWTNRAQSKHLSGASPVPVKPTFVSDTGDGTGAVNFDDAGSTSTIQALQNTATLVDWTADASVVMLIKVTNNGAGGTSTQVFSAGAAAANSWLRWSHAHGYSLEEFDCDTGNPGMSGGGGLTVADSSWVLVHFYRHGTKFGMRNINTNTTKEATIVGGHPSAAQVAFTVGCWFFNSVFSNGSVQKVKTITTFSAFLDTTGESTLKGLLHPVFSDCPA